MRSRPSVLIAEDDARARESLCELLQDEGYDVTGTADGNEASDLLASGDFEGLLLDVRMPGRDGLTLLRDLSARRDAPAVLVMTAFGSASVAIEAMKLGAFDYVVKPLRFEEVRILLDRAINSRRQALHLNVCQDEAAVDGTALVGSSPAMQRVYKMIGQVARTDSTVLIEGESGTGKELVARAIHAHSNRSAKPLSIVNCAAIPEALLESELFGHEKGAFTGAVSRHRGKFELADRGTLFLDEIGELGPAMQAKLLRALQEQTVEPLGSSRTLQIDVRILAATNRNLEERVRQGCFREDLYYRLNVVVVRVPPLRERREDIPELCAFLLRKLAAKSQIPVPAITEDALNVLSAMHWPGNVRELEHALERAIVLSHGRPVSRDVLSLMTGVPACDPFDSLPLGDGMHAMVAKLERRLIERALEQASGNRTRAADILKINRRLLYDKLREYGLE